MARNVVEIPYVEPHGKAFRYRRIVPADVIDKLGGRKRWTKTFRVRTPLSAIELHAKRLASEHDKLIARARDGEVLSPEIIAEAERQAQRWLADHDKRAALDAIAFIAAETNGSAADRAFLNAMQHGGRYKPEGLRLTAAHERDREMYGAERDEKAFEYAVSSFVAVIGDKEITAITRDDVAAWLKQIKKQGMAAGTIRRRLGALRAITNRAYLDLNYAGRNPFEKHDIKQKGRARDLRLPFNRAMLALIDSYLATNKRVGHETRNVIRMMKCTGAGPAEIGGLVLADVRLNDEVPFIWIRHNAIRGIKTDERDRRVPLVGDALEAAKDAYRRATLGLRRANYDDVPLFKSFGASGRGADSISAKLNKAIRAAGVPESRRLVAYSFRHTMKEALRVAGVPDFTQRRLLGHAGRDDADNYGGSSEQMRRLRTVVETAVQHLGDVDDAMYSAKERMK